MNPRDKAAGKRIVGSSSNWNCSLPPNSPFSVTPFSTHYQAGSSHFSPGPAPVMTQSSSQVFSLPLNASPMSSPPRNPSLSPFPDSLTTWSPYPYMSFTELLNQGQVPFSLEPPVVTTQPLCQAHSPMFPPSSSASVTDLLNLLLSPNWSFQGNIPLTNSRKENVFSSGPLAVTTQPSSQAFSFPLSRTPMLPSTPSASMSTSNNSQFVSFTELLNQAHSPNWNLQGQVSFTASGNENAFSSGPTQPSFQASSSLPVSFSMWSTSPTVSFSDSLNQLPSPNWNLQGHVPFTNPVNGTENSLFLSPYASQAPSPNWNGNVPSTNLVGWNENSFSLQSPKDPNTPYGLNQISTNSKHAGVVSNPKKVQRILKNRESAARSWEKKQRYVTDLLDRIKFLEEAYDSLSSKLSISEEENKKLREAPKRKKNQKQTKDQKTQVGEEDLIEYLVADTKMHNSGESNEQETSLECVYESSS